MQTTLGDVLEKIHEIQARSGGGYSLFLPCDEVRDPNKTLQASMQCAIYFISREDDLKGFNPPDSNMCEILSVQMTQSIVKVAREQKPNITHDELVMSFVYYINNDAFYEFS